MPFDQFLTAIGQPSGVYASDGPGPAFANYVWWTLVLIKNVCNNATNRIESREQESLL